LKLLFIISSSSTPPFPKRGTKRVSPEPGRYRVSPEPRWYRVTGNFANGFTLIEVLISLAILVIVLGAVYSSFFSVQRAIERFDSISLKYHEARTALDIMRREIESALIKNPEFSNDDSEEEKVRAVFILKDRDIFGKSTSSIELTAFSFKGSRLNTISYFVEEKGGKLDLFKKESPSIFGAKEYTSDIIEGIESFTIETLYKDKWIRTWDTENTDRLPDTVRVSIEFDDNGKTVKLTEYASPKIGKKL
jgi:general secretion pathway protein J